MSKGSLLMVEDEELVREAMARVLRGAGYTVDETAAGQEAVKKLQETSYDLLLVDLRMPEMNGLDLLERCRRLDPQIATVVITGYGTLENTIRALEIGVNGFLMKPVFPHQLLGAAKEVLGRQRLIKERKPSEVYHLVMEIERLSAQEETSLSFARKLLEQVISKIYPGHGVLFLRQKDDELIPVATSYGATDSISPLGPAMLHRLDHTLSKVEDLMDQRHTLSWPKLTPVEGDVNEDMCLPLLYLGQVMGLLVLQRDVRYHPISVTTIEVLWIVCSFAATALEGLRLRSERGHDYLRAPF